MVIVVVIVIIIVIVVVIIVVAVDGVDSTDGTHNNVAGYANEGQKVQDSSLGTTTLVTTELKGGKWKR